MCPYIIRDIGTGILKKYFFHFVSRHINIGIIDSSVGDFNVLDGVESDAELLI